MKIAALTFSLLFLSMTCPFAQEASISHQQLKDYLNSLKKPHLSTAESIQESRRFFAKGILLPFYYRDILSRYKNKEGNGKIYYVIPGRSNDPGSFTINLVVNANSGAVETVKTQGEIYEL